MNPFVKSAGTILGAAVLVSTVAGCAGDIDHPMAARPTPRVSQPVTVDPSATAQPSTPAAAPTSQAIPSSTMTPSTRVPASPSTSSPSTSGPPPSSPAPVATPTATPTSSPTATVAIRLRPGSTGVQVRELQHRLRQLNWYAGKITESYGPATSEAVTGFQRKRQLPGTGIVDEVTWQKLVSMSRMPTRDEMFNVLTPGPALHRSGDSGDDVRAIQARLKQLDWFSEQVTGTYGPVTVAAVKGFQEKREIPVTGEVDRRTLDLLVAMTRTPTAEELVNKPPATSTPTQVKLDQRCMTGRVLCISKDSRRMYWVVQGKVVDDWSVRFGSIQTPTREGTFSVYWKSRDHHSTLYDSPMPFAMFFDGGQAVHYSADFAARGYDGASHGCVNVRDYDGIKWLFDEVRVGDKVVVHR